MRTAVFVAKQFNSEIHLLHVMPGTVDFCSDARGMFIKKIDDRLREIAEQIEAEEIQVVKTVVDHGVVFDSIDQQATKRDVNVIIMGAGHVDDDGRLQVGTKATRVRRIATQPVWLVKPGSLPQVNRILCPVDCSASSGRGAEECDSSVADLGRVGRADGSVRRGETL